MRAVVYDRFGGLPTVCEVPDSVPGLSGAVVRVESTGLCRSDWHAWMGHDPDVRLPQIPGHEFAGVIEALGSDLGSDFGADLGAATAGGWRIGDRVTAPFVCACGRCAWCLSGDHQVCDRQTQPGFSYAGSFAEYVVVDHAAINLVRLPDGLGFDAAAALGCRFATAFRAVVTQGRVRAGEWVAVFGCGGVGLSAVMIAVACGARVVAVDVSTSALASAARLGAEVCLDAVPGVAGASALPGAAGADIGAAVREVTGGGAHVSLDALGSGSTCAASINALRRRGRHIQVGLLSADDGWAGVPMNRVVAYELTLLGSHGMAAHAYPPMLGLVARGVLRPELLVSHAMPLSAAPAALAGMDRAGDGGAGGGAAGEAGVGAGGGAIALIHPADPS